MREIPNIVLSLYNTNTYPINSPPSYSPTFFVAHIYTDHMALSSPASFATSNFQIALKRVSNVGRSNFIQFKKYASQTRRISQDPSLLHSSSSTPFKLVNYETLQTRTTDDMFVQHSQRLDSFGHLMSSVAQRDPLEGLNMIDAVQRLDIDYHYQREIDEILHKQMCMITADGDLHEIALRFRLLRQQGHNVSEEVFDNFKDSKVLSKDIKGLMSLYEASQLSIEGEDRLVEAGGFSAHLLKTSLTHLDPHQARIVANTLENPHHKSLASFMARNFFVTSRGTNTWINFLKEVAKTDFQMVQPLHQIEIVQITKWWKELGLAKELKFARDQPLKWYMWSMAVLPDPKFSEERIELTKPISFIYLIDDIFDVYGTLDELTLFTEAVNRYMFIVKNFSTLIIWTLIDGIVAYRWDITAIDQLPDFMKICVKGLFDMTNEISCKVYQKHGWDPLHSFQKTWATLCNAFLVEAKWFASGQLPKTEDYLKNGIVSSGVHVVLVHIFFLLGQNITKESVELLNNSPAVISSTAAILRLWDDLGSAKDENQDGNDGSYVRCYLEEHPDCSFEEAQEMTVNMISEEWKHLNRELLSTNPFPATFISASLDFARMVPLMYSYDNNQSLPSLKEYMKSMLYVASSM